MSLCYDGNIFWNIKNNWKNNGKDFDNCPYNIPEWLWTVEVMFKHLKTDLHPPIESVSYKIHFEFQV